MISSFFQLIIYYLFCYINWGIFERPPQFHSVWVTMFEVIVWIVEWWR